jgi:glycogen synthase
VASLRVLRLCSVFEPPDAALSGRGARFDPIGGMQSHTGQLTRALDRRGVRQIVVTHRPPGAPARQRIGECADVHRFGLPIAPARQLYSLAATVAALRLARHADLVHVHAGEDLAIVPIGLAAARRASLPLVITVHCSLRHTLTGAGARALMLKGIGAAVELAACRHADMVIALTPRLAGHLRDDGVAPQRVRVIPSGVSTAAFADDLSDPFPDIGHPRIVYAGRLAHSKGVDTLVDAAARMRHTAAKLLIVGDGPERASLDRRIRRHGIGECVHIAGFVPHRAIPAVLRHAELLCLPARYEELGSVLLEAMQAAVPIVASYTGGIPGVVGGAARLVPPGDAAALARALDALLGDRDEAARLAAVGSERARSYDWERLAGEILHVYAAAIAAHAERPAQEPTETLERRVVTTP